MRFQNMLQRAAQANYHFTPREAFATDVGCHCQHNRHHPSYHTSNNGPYRILLALTYGA